MNKDNLSDKDHKILTSRFGIIIMAADSMKDVVNKLPDNIEQQFMKIMHECKKFAGLMMEFTNTESENGNES